MRVEGEGRHGVEGEGRHGEDVEQNIGIGGTTRGILRRKLFKKFGLLIGLFLKMC